MADSAAAATRSAASGDRTLPGSALGLSATDLVVALGIAAVSLLGYLLRRRPPARLARLQRSP